MFKFNRRIVWAYRVLIALINRSPKPFFSKVLNIKLFNRIEGFIKVQEKYITIIPQ